MTALWACLLPTVPAPRRGLTDVTIALECRCPSRPPPWKQLGKSRGTEKHPDSGPHTFVYATLPFRVSRAVHGPSLNQRTQGPANRESCSVLVEPSSTSVGPPFSFPHSSPPREWGKGLSFEGRQGEQREEGTELQMGGLEKHPCVAWGPTRLAIGS